MVHFEASELDTYIIREVILSMENAEFRMNFELWLHLCSLLKTDLMDVMRFVEEINEISVI